MVLDTQHKYYIHTYAEVAPSMSFVEAANPARIPPTLLPTN